MIKVLLFFGTLAGCIAVIVLGSFTAIYIEDNWKEIKRGFNQLIKRKVYK